ncbi:transposase, IS110 family [Klebsiella oxytoca]|nr:transposase, IS110 family [Klebsiella oxytoca]
MSVLFVLLCELSEELQGLDERVARHDRRLQQSARDDIRIKRLLAIEGMGPVGGQCPGGCSGVMADSSGAAGKWRLIWGWFRGSTQAEGKARLGHISKRGDRYVRTLIIHGARAVLNACQNKTDRRSQWLQGVSERRNRNIATVALANKNARIAWALLSREEDYHGIQVTG